MHEVFGDSSRNGEWAAVRLRVDGDRIVEADAPGLERELTGLTLLEAAAVGGETLAVDALANALGPIFRAEPSPGRIAVAMSGGVDSAVALLRSLPNAVGVTLRLWLDPDGPDSERACCSPESVIAARETCHRLGVPHVTLDLREEFRRAVVTPFVRGYARGETPNPCTRCNGGFRFAELLAFARRAGAERLATGHYARIVERDGRLLLARGADPAKDQSYMLAGARPAATRARRLPARRAGQGGDAGRSRARRARRRPASRRARRRASSPATTTARSSAGTGSSRGRARSSARTEATSAATTASGASRPASGAASGSSAGEPLYVLGTQPSTNAVVVGPRESLARTEVTARGRLYADAERVEAKLRYRSPAVRRARRADGRRFPARARRAGLRRRGRPGGGALRRRHRRRIWLDHRVALRSDQDAGRGIQLEGDWPEPPRRFRR